MHNMNGDCEIGSKEEGLRRGPWTIEEDNMLIQSINFNGEGSWNSLAKYAGLQRTGKSCRLRWLNYLKPDVKRGSLTPQEQLLVLELHFKFGNRWSKIAKHLPGRTDNGIKNYWRTRVQKQARQLKLDSNSHKFLEAVRMFWKPRLLQNMDQDLFPFSSPSPLLSSSISTEKTLETQKSGPSCPNSDSMENNISGNNSSKELIIQLPGDECPSPGESTTEKFRFGSSIVDDYCNSYYFCEAIQSDYFSDVAMPECHVSGVDWFEENTSWNTDELWNI